MHESEFSSSVTQEVFQHLHTVFGEDGLGVELNAVDRKLLVHEAHDGAILSFRGDLQAIGQGVALDDEGVVAGGCDRAGKAGENTFASMENRGCFAMHEVFCADDFTSKNLADGLVAEADAEDGSGVTKLADDITTDASFVWRAGARGDANALGGEFADFVDAHSIIANHLHFRAKLAKVLHEVVGEGVVVIDNEEHLNSEF